MSKRRQNDQSQDQQSKRLNLGDEVNTVNDAINTLVQQCTNEGSCDIDTIARSNSAINCLNNGTALILVMRAYALARIGRQEDAIKDVKRAIENRPERAEGYIAASDIFSMQGRQRAAIEVLEVGLRSVPASEQALLHQRQAIANELLERKVDFVAKLPTEIAVNIFSRLDNDVIQTSCTTVSKLWRHTLLQQCPELWRTVTIANYYFPSPATRLLPWISNHVQSLTVRNVSEGILKRMFEMAANEKFQSVTEFAIETKPSLITGYPMLILSLLRRNLTKLEIKIAEERLFNGDVLDVEFRSDAALSLCPNMKEFSITSYGLVTYRPPELSTFANYQLTTLHIDIPHPQDVLEGLIPNCPRLESLNVLGELHSSIIFPHIQQHCPLLRHLVTFKSPSTGKLNNINDNGQPGLYTLQHTIRDMGDIQAVISIVTNNKSTLTTLNLDVYDSDDYREGLDQLSAIELYQVKNLDLVCKRGGRWFGFFTASIIRHCPALETVNIDFAHIVLLDQFFMCLTTHSRLHTLKISHVHMVSSGLQELFMHLSGLGEKCALKSFTSQCSKAITDEVLNQLTRIRTLQTIKVSEVYEDMVTVDGITAFIHQLKAIPQLKALYLDSIPCITDTLIVELAKLKELHTLSLTDIEDVSFNGVRSLLDRLGPIKSVTIDDCGGLDYRAGEQ